MSTFGEYRGLAASHELGGDVTMLICLVKSNF